MLKQLTSCDTENKISHNLIQSNLYYIEALQMRLDVELLKLELKLSDKMLFKKQSSFIIKKMMREIQQIRSLTKQEIFELKSPEKKYLINLDELDINSLNYLLHMESRSETI